MAITQIDPRQIEKLNAITVQYLIDPDSIPASLLVADVSDAELSFLAGVTSGIQAQLNARFLKADFKNTSSVVWTDDLTAVSAAAIAAKISSEIASAQIGGVMVYKGAWSQVPATIALNTIKSGWTFTYDSGSAITGHTLEAGDQIIAKVDNPSLSVAANWTVVQANISGAVTSIESAVTDSQMVIFSGTSGKIMKKLTLSGLLKVVNGVPAIAGAADLPAHNHPTAISVQGAAAGDFTDVLRFKGNNCTITYNDSTKELSITVPQLLKTDWKHNVSMSGTQNGTNKVFTLPEAIVLASESIFLNGVMLTRGVDYTISGTTVTLSSELFAPETKHTLRANYIKS